MPQLIVVATACIAVTPIQSKVSSRIPGLRGSRRQNRTITPARPNGSSSPVIHQTGVSMAYQ